MTSFESVHGEERVSLEGFSLDAVLSRYREAYPDRTVYMLDFSVTEAPAGSVSWSLTVFWRENDYACTASASEDRAV